MKNNNIKIFVFIILMFSFIIVKADASTVPVIPSGDIHTCTDLLGTNLLAVVKSSVTILQIVAAIIAIIKGMITLIPPILAKDADALKKAGKTLTNMAIVLLVIFLFKPIILFIGNVLSFDSSCI